MNDNANDILREPCGCEAEICDNCGEHVLHPDGLCRACLIPEDER